MLTRLLGRLKERMTNSGARKPPERLRDVPATNVAGSWQAAFREPDRSLIISGKTEDGADKVYLMFNGRLLGAAVANEGSFRFLIQKAGKKGFAPGASFQVVTDNGVLPHASGVTSWRVFDHLVGMSARFLDLDKHIDQGDRLTKKGSIAPHTISDIKKERYCKLVNRLDAWFLENRGRSIMVSHGTLLGLYRSGDLVPYDDDFDCLYLSRQDNISGVVEERLEIALGLLRAGFDCRLGKTGHIKVRNKYVEVDLMPAWIEDDVLHISSYSQIPGASRFVEPPSVAVWGQHGRLSTFARPEIFLEAQYGPNWRSPDPGYRANLSACGKRNRKLLAPTPEALAILRDAREEYRRAADAK